MKKQKTQRKQKKGSSSFLPLAALVLLVAGVILIVVLRMAKPASATTLVEMEQTEPVVKNEETIDIPGYELLNLAADTREQSISLSNPPQNTCYFQITLCLEDGTELWTSELIPPGYKSAAIRLTRALPKGSYPNAILRYACFSMDESRRLLNGAETRLTIVAK